MKTNMKLLTVNDVAKVLGKTRQCVHHHINKENSPLKATKLGRQTFILQKDLDIFLSNR